MNKWIGERWTNKGIIRNGTKQTFHSFWCPVSHTWPKHVGLLCSSLSQVKNTVGLCAAPTIFLPHTPARGFSVCGCAFLALWFGLMSSVLHRSAPLLLFSRKDSRNPPVHHRESWCYQQVLHCPGKKQRWCHVSVLSRKTGGQSQKDRVIQEEQDWIFLQELLDLGFMMERISMWGYRVLAYLLGISVLYWLK